MLPDDAWSQEAVHPDSVVSHLRPQVGDQTESFVCVNYWPLAILAMAARRGEEDYNSVD